MSEGLLGQFEFWTSVQAAQDANGLRRVERVLYWTSSFLRVKVETYYARDVEGYSYFFCSLNVKNNEGKTFVRKGDLLDGELRGFLESHGASEPLEAFLLTDDFMVDFDAKSKYYRSRDLAWIVSGKLAFDEEDE